MENPRARWARACPIRLKPTMPRRRVMHVPAQHHKRLQIHAVPERTNRSPSAIRRAAAIISASAVSAVVSVSTPACCRPAAALSACLQVDVAKAHGVVRHDLELGPGGPQKLLVDAVGDQRARRFEGPQAE